MYVVQSFITSKELFLFNNENIQKIFFIGFQDGEELLFREFLDSEINSKE